MLNLIKNKFRQPEGLYIRPSQRHGLGVFAIKDYRRGAIIEICPVILMQPTDLDYLQGTILFNYYFLAEHEKFPVALGLGYSSLYNHSSQPNAMYSISVKKKFIKITAYREILPGDEITINYNGVPDDDSPVFFATYNE